MKVARTVTAAVASTEFSFHLTSEANAGGKLRDKLARKKRIKSVVSLQLLTVRGLIRIVGLPCVVTLTRIGPRELDGDNLQGAFKAVRDMVALELGVDDADPRVTWEYAQEPRRDHAVRIRVGSRA
ncbi:MAG: Bcep22 hypothetical protein [Phycisphaerales bacterium]|nr:Bcep22 hypothetical protein [Phycisphaerales bacterium]